VLTVPVLIAARLKTISYSRRMEIPSLPRRWARLLQPPRVPTDSGKMVGGVSAGMLDFHSADLGLYWQEATAEYLSAKARAIIIPFLPLILCTRGFCGLSASR